MPPLAIMRIPRIYSLLEEVFIPGKKEMAMHTYLIPIVLYLCQEGVKRGLLPSTLNLQVVVPFGFSGNEIGKKSTQLSGPI